MLALTIGGMIGTKTVATTELGVAGTRPVSESFGPTASRQHYQQQSLLTQPQATFGILFLGLEELMGLPQNLLGGLIYPDQAGRPFEA